MRWLEGLVLVAIGLHFHRAFVWIARSWSEQTYESWGFLPLILLLPHMRRMPARRMKASTARLAGILAVSAFDLLLWRLRLNIVSATLAIVALHLWLVAFREYAGRWYAQRQLWLALLCLPLVYWGNVLLGYQVQHFATRVAAAWIGLYGQPVITDGTLLQFPSRTIAVDAACSGIKLLYAGLLFGLLALPNQLGWLRRLAFWGALLTLLLLANVARILSLALAELHFGAISERLHEGIGLAAFATACALALLILRRLACASGAHAAPAGER
jgi:exosortase/archaeosortase family protein